MDGCWKRYLASEMVRHQTNRHLALTMRLLVDRSCDRPFFEIRRHLGEEIRRYQLCLSREASRAQRTANGEAVDGVHIKSGESWNPAQKIKRLLETFVFVFVPFDNAGDLPSGAVPRKCFREPGGFLAMILGTQHASNDGHFGAGRHKFAHQLPRQSAV